MFKTKENCTYLSIESQMTARELRCVVYDGLDLMIPATDIQHNKATLGSLGFNRLYQKVFIGVSYFQSITPSPTKMNGVSTFPISSRQLQNACCVMNKTFFMVSMKETSELCFQTRY